MGYYTAYDLKTEPESLEAYDAASKANGYQWVVFGGHKVKWYSHEVDMALVSRDYPDVVFVLSGTGEDGNEDMWVKYFSDGRVHRVKAQITYDAFDPAELREPQS